MANKDRKPPVEGGDDNRIPEKNSPGANPSAIDDLPTAPEMPAVDEQPTHPITEMAQDQQPAGTGESEADPRESVIPDLPTARVPAVDEQQAPTANIAGENTVGQGNAEIADLPTTRMPAVDEQPQNVGKASNSSETEAVLSTPQRPVKPGAALAKKTALVKVDQKKSNVSSAVAPSSSVAPPAGVTPVISVRNVTKVYVLGKKTQVPALRGISLEVYPGEFVAVLGPSGSGKSTFMNILGCLDRPTGGEYWLAGKLVSRMGSDELAGIRNQLIGFVFQGFNLLGRATALSNVGLPMVYAGIPKTERDRRARRVLQLVGLGGRIHHKPSELSGGQQQRVAIARSLVNGPALLLADEPTGNLDSRTSIEIMGVLQALNDQGLTIVLVTHDLKVAAYAKRQVTFLDGRILRDEINLSPRSAVEEWNALQAEAEDQNSAMAQVGTTQVKEEPR